MNIAQAMALDDAEQLVFPLAQARVDDDRPVVRGMDPLWAIAVSQHGIDDALQLPRRCRATGEEEVPAAERAVRHPHRPFGPRAGALYNIGSNGLRRLR